MIRSPIFKAKPAGWRRWTNGRMQIPINAAAFFLALFLVTAAATFAGGALGVALPTRITERPPIANVDGHADHRSIQTMGFSQDFNGNGWEQAELYQGRHRTSE